MVNTLTSFIQFSTSSYIFFFNIPSRYFYGILFYFFFSFFFLSIVESNNDCLNGSIEQKINGTLKQDITKIDNDIPKESFREKLQVYDDEEIPIESSKSQEHEFSIKKQILEKLEKKNYNSDSDQQIKTSVLTHQDFYHITESVNTLVEENEKIQANCNPIPTQSVEVLGKTPHGKEFKESNKKPLKNLSNIDFSSNISKIADSFAISNSSFANIELNTSQNIDTGHKYRRSRNNPNIIHMAPKEINDFAVGKKRGPSKNRFHLLLKKHAETNALNDTKILKLQQNTKEQRKNLREMFVYKIPKIYGGTTHVNALDIALQSTDNILKSTARSEDPIFEGINPIALDAYSQYHGLIKSRYLAMIDLLDSNYVLERDSRKTKIERDNLRKQLLDLVQQRFKLTSKIVAVRHNYNSNENYLDKFKEIDRFLLKLNSFGGNILANEVPSLYYSSSLNHKIRLKVEWLNFILDKQERGWDDILNFNKSMALVDSKIQF